MAKHNPKCYPYARTLKKTLDRICEEYVVRNIDFIFVIRDEIQYSEPFMIRGPFFMQSKFADSFYEKKSLLIPDGYMANEVCRASSENSEQEQGNPMVPETKQSFLAWVCDRKPWGLVWSF